MQSHQLSRKHPNKKSRQVGRGGKRGTTSGRGTKGQKSRSGHRIRPAVRDVLKKLPKKRGYKFASPSVAQKNVKLSDVEKLFETGAVINVKDLTRVGLIRRTDRQKVIKLVGKDKLTKSLSLAGIITSAGAREAILAAGGKIDDK